MATPYERRQFKGSAVKTALTGSITSTTLTLTIADPTGWPDGSTGPFFVVIDRATTTEESVQVASRTAGTLTVASTANRGLNDTTAVSHVSGAPIEHVATKRDFDEANYVTAQTVGKVAAAGDLLVGSGTNVLARLPRGVDGEVLTTTGGAVSWAAPDIPEGAATTEALDAEVAAREDEDTALHAADSSISTNLFNHAAVTTTAHGGPYLSASAAAGNALTGNYPNPGLAPVGAAKIGTDWPTFAATKPVTLTDNVVQVVTFTTAQEAWKVGFTHSTGSTDWVVGRACYLNLSAWADFATGLYDNEVNVEIRQNGTAIWKAGGVMNGARDPNMVAQGPAKAALGDVFTVAVYQNSGGSLACTVKFAANFAGNV